MAFTQEDWDNTPVTSRRKYRTINNKHKRKLLTHIDISDMTKERAYEKQHKKAQESDSDSSDSEPESPKLKLKSFEVEAKIKVIPESKIESKPVSDDKSSSSESSTSILKRTVSGVRNLAVKFVSKFNKKDNCKTFHELDKNDVVKNKLDLSNKFVKRIEELKQAEGKNRRGQTTGLYMQCILERIIRVYYKYNTSIPSVTSDQVANLRTRFGDQNLDVNGLLENFYNVDNKLDPLAPLIAMSHTNASKGGGETLRNLYQFLKRKGYDLYTEYRDCMFKVLPRDIQVDTVRSEHHVSEFGCRGRIDIYCNELLIDSKCTIKDDFHSDLSQLLLYKLLVEESEKQSVKRVMIVNPCLSYAYIVDVSKWAGTRFREFLQKREKAPLPRYASDSNLKRNEQPEQLQRSKSQKFLTRSLSTFIKEASTNPENEKSIAEDINSVTIISELALAKEKSRLLTEQLKEKEKDYDKLSFEYAAFRKEHVLITTRQAAQINKYQDKILQLTSSLEKVQKKYDMQCSHYKREINDLQQTNGSLQRTCESLQRFRDNLLQSRDELSQRCDEYEKLFDDTSAKLAVQSSKLRDLEANVKILREECSENSKILRTEGVPCNIGEKLDQLLLLFHQKTT
jgi:hypothetical protein